MFGKLCGFINPSPLLIHFHFFKNAGTTVEWALQRNFGDRFKQFDDFSNPYNNYHNTDLKAFVSRHPNISVLSSHQLRLPPPHIPQKKIYGILFLRHPLDRAYSVYNYEKKRAFAVYSEEKTTGGNGRTGLKDANLNMQDFFQTLTNNRSLSVVTNYQALMLSYYKGIQLQQNRLTTNNLAVARKRIRQIKIVGMVERFDESMVLAEYLLMPAFGVLDFSYKPKNVNTSRLQCLQSRLQDMQRQLSNSFYKQFCELNKYDFELYQFAKQELDKKLARIPNLKERLLDFKARGARL